MMFKRKYKDANEDIPVHESLKQDTMQKMKDNKTKNKRFNSPIKVSIIALAILIVATSLVLNNKKTDTYAIAAPEYPTEIGFEDIDQQIERREDIDEKFIKNLNNFSIQSSSMILSDMDTQANSLYSPISLYMALAMVGETASGETQDQIINALNMDNVQMIRNETGKLFRTLYFHNEIGKLSLNNSLWLNKEFIFNKNTLDLLAKDYYAHSFSLDFNDKSSSKKISKWVSENTGGKLGNNADDFSLDKDGRMVLINTVIFYDEWIDTFDANNTKEDIFHLEDGKEVESDFMNMTYTSHQFVGAEGYTSSALQMKNNNSMIFILPDEGVSPFDIVSDPNILEDAISSLSTDKSSTGEVVFKIPKFDFSSDLELNDMANKLGIVDAFKGNADFSPLSDTKPLFISDIKQSSFISIDEKGVEASAFTKIDYDGSSQPQGRADMILDRPFIFVITGIDNSPLFIGVINNPLYK